MNFESLGLSAPILRALSACDYREPTPIQQKAIPPALEGRDVLGCAQTGTGKTCAFGTPMLQRLAAKERTGKGVRALILTPTRELALQIDENLKEYSKHLPLRTTVIFGGVGQTPQVEQLKRGIDILTATPGRLLDLSAQGLIDLKSVEIFVLDEADRMLDMGFIHDVKKIIALLPSKKQTLFFSATMPEEIMELVDSLLQDPVHVAVNPVSSPVELIRQQVYLVDRKNKTKLLADILVAEGVKNALVFTRTKHGADKVTRELTQAGVKASAIHGNKSQTARQTALSDFKNGTLQVLVATDIAARGIDIDELSYVFNYNLPEVPETYVHRIGRTGRAGRGGTAISFCDHSEEVLLRGIEKLLGKPVPRVEDHAYPMVEFETLRRDAKGRVLNLDDEEARQAARQKRAEKQKANRVKKVAKDTEEVPQASPKPKEAKKQEQRQEELQVSAKARRTRNKRPQGNPNDPLPAHPAEQPEQIARRNPLAGEVIMDATARMFASRAAKLPIHTPRSAKQGKKGTASEGKREAKPTEPVAKAPVGREEKPTQKRRKKPKQGKEATPIVVVKPSEGQPKPKEASKPGSEAERAGRGMRKRVPVVQGPRSRQKDSTEQKSLMKPFYIEHD